MDLYSSFRSYDKNVVKTNATYSGLLGLTIDGLQRVEHPTRNGFVYFRFRDNLSETALAFNDKVSPVFDLPVVVERRNNYWYVIGRDVERYSNWGSSAPFLPKHGFQHSFDRDAGTGGDVVFVYPDQFVPLLVYPSGTEGASNLLVAPYVLQRTADFLYVGNTGTPNLLLYRPTDTSAIMGLVYLDRNTGNPGILINSGTSFSSSLTGTPDIAQYIPYPSSTQEPLYAFRLVSGTQALQWSNLYNVRQFVGGGTSTGSSIGALTPLRVVITDSSGTITTDPELYYDEANNTMVIGDSSIAPVLVPNSFQMVNDGASPSVALASYGSGTAPFVVGFKADGSAASPTNVKDEQVLFRLRARGHDGVGFSNTQGEIRYVAEGDWDAGSHPIKIEYYATPTGSTTLQRVAGMHGDRSFWLVNSVSGTVARPDSGETAIGTDSLTKRLYSIDDAGNRTDYLASGTLPNPFALPADITPPLLSGTYNDFSPSGLSTSDVLRLESVTDTSTLTGLAGGSDGRVIVIQNVGTFPIILSNLSSGSLSQNQFSVRDDVTIPNNGGSVVLIYDSTSSKWRMLTYVPNPFDGNIQNIGTGAYPGTQYQWARGDHVHGGQTVETLYDNTLTATGTFNITNISSDFKHLEIRTYLRTNRAALFENVLVRFNNDSGANYDYLSRSANASASAGLDAFGQTSALAAFCSAASTTSGIFSVGIWFINNYAGTVGHKKMHCRNEDEEQNTTGNYYIYDMASRWASTAAINRIFIFPGSGGSFIAGSRVTVYGYR